MNFKIILLSILLIFFVACNDSNNELSESIAHEHNSSEHDNHTNNEIQELTLNNGEKWKIDESTRFHTSNLVKIVEEFENQNSTNLDSYHKFADKMLLELQELINKCTMDGKDHDALHLWLEPVLNETKSIKNSDNINNISKSSAILIKDVKKFNNYFE